MKCHPLHGRTRVARIVSAVALFFVFVFAVLTLATPFARCQGREVTPPVQDKGPVNSGAPSISQPAGSQSAPSPAPFPFLHLVTALCSGLIISAARLGRKFRLFWGLGVFTNLYAVSFLILGVVLCGFPVATEGALKALPVIGSMNPWIADLLGIIVALALPAIPFKRQSRAIRENQVRDVEGASSSNPILALIEDAIRDCIVERMQKEIVEACRQYDWGTIKLAAERALAEEMAVRPLPDEKYADVRQSIEAFASDPDPHRDSTNKYVALAGLLGWCSFKRLISGLDTAARDSKL